MQEFSFHCPTEIVFGRGVEERTAELLRKYGAHRVFIVYGGGSVIKNGLLARVERVITAAGLAFSVRGGVRPNPRLSFAREAVREAIDFEADFLLAVGGGSVIDTAKAIAHGTANPDTDIWDFWLGKKELKKSLPVGVILTLPAAGSETSDSSVLTNEETGEKAGLPSPFNRPAFAILNPELAFSLSSPQLAAGIADIVMHTLERYMTHTEGNEFTDLLAEALLQNVAKYAPIVLAHHKNYEAMSEIMWCGTISHCGLTGLGRDKDFSVHKLGHALSARYDTNHGESLTALCREGLGRRCGLCRGAGACGHPQDGGVLPLAEAADFARRASDGHLGARRLGSARRQCDGQWHEDGRHIPLRRPCVRLEDLHGGEPLSLQPGIFMQKPHDAYEANRYK